MKTSPQRIAFFLFAIILTAIAGTSCRTIRGIGQDVDHAGRHLENATHR